MEERILIVDDEKEIADLLEIYCVNENYTVYKFYSPVEALSCLQREPIDLAVIDVMMPEMSGFTLCRRIREQYYFPVIMLTAKVEDADKIAGLTMGADDYVTKPFHPPELMARIKTQLRRYKKYNAQTPLKQEIEYDFRGLCVNRQKHRCELYGEEVLLTPIAFFLKIPYVIPIACGLVLSPVSMVAVACGTIVFYMLEYVRENASSLEGSADLMTQIPGCLKQVFQNKEMWIVIAAFIICCFVVYTLRRQAMDHAWKIAIVAGAVANIIVIAVGDIAFGVHTSYGPMIAGSIAAVVIGLVLELFFFTVDYARSENLQYEDDEYYYYVKAVPKISVAAPEKTVKRINERQETEIIDAEEVRRQAKKRRHMKDQDVDNMLLTRSLKEEFKKDK